MEFNSGFKGLIKNIFQMLQEQSKRDQILQQLLSQHIIKILPVQCSYKQYNWTPEDCT